MMQTLRATTERVNAAAARVVDPALTTLFGGSVTANLVDGPATNDTATNGFSTFFVGTAWNAMPVHTPAICTHGKRYQRRLQEMLT